MKKYFQAIVLALITSSSAWSAVSSVTIEGTVASFDEKTVTIKQRQGVTKVPRKYVRSKKLKAGDAVSLSLTPEEFQQLSETKK